MLTLALLALAAQAPSQSGAATPAPAPSPQASAANTEIGTRAQAFSACLDPKVAAVAPAMTPEQGADSVMAGCKTEQTALEQSIETAIAAAPEDQKVAARKRMSDSMTRARTQIADAIRQSRGASPAAPATPATPPK